MALTYADTASLMLDPAFHGRVKVACLHYADYIWGEPSSTPAHNTRFRWSQQTMANPDISATNVMPTLVGEPEIQASGAEVTDADLQTATENALNKTM